MMKERTKLRDFCIKAVIFMLSFLYNFLLTYTHISFFDLMTPSKGKTRHLVSMKCFCICHILQTLDSVSYFTHTLNSLFKKKTWRGWISTQPKVSTIFKRQNLNFVCTKMWNYLFDDIVALLQDPIKYFQDTENPGVSKL